MPQEFDPAPSAPAAEQFAARQKITPEEATAALDALHARQQAPLDFDLDLSIGQVLDELDLPLPAADLWREVQALRAQKTQATTARADVSLATTSETARRRGRIAAGTLAAVLALSVPVLRYARLSAPPDVPPAATGPAPSAARPAAPQTTETARNNANSDAPSTQNGTNTPSAQNTSGTDTPQNAAQTSTSVAQNVPNTRTSATQTVPAHRFRLPEPGNIINADNQTRTVTADTGQVVIGGNGDTITVRGVVTQMIVNGNRAVVRLRGPVGQVILGGNGSTVTYSRAFPAPQVIDNGTGNTFRAEERGPKLDSPPPARL